MPGTAATGVRLAELLGRLSLAFDIANGSPHGKVVRSVVLAVELGRLAGATDAELHDAFWLSLLGHLGCTGLADEEGSLTATPMSGSDEAARAMFDTSVRLAQIVGAGPRILSALTQRFERDVSGHLASDALVLPICLSRIAHLAETAHQQHGREAAVALVRGDASGRFDPGLAKVFVDGQRELCASIEDPPHFGTWTKSRPSFRFASRSSRSSRACATSRTS